MVYLAPLCGRILYRVLLASRLTSWELLPYYFDSVFWIVSYINNDIYIYLVSFSKYCNCKMLLIASVTSRCRMST